jgi:hypothetical protein
MLSKNQFFLAKKTKTKLDFHFENLIDLNKIETN